jgi:hypothetical protein
MVALICASRVPGWLVPYLLPTAAGGAQGGIPAEPRVIDTFPSLRHTRWEGETTRKIAAEASMAWLDKFIGRGLTCASSVWHSAYQNSTPDFGGAVACSVQRGGGTVGT